MQLTDVSAKLQERLGRDEVIVLDGGVGAHLYTEDIRAQGFPFPWSVEGLVLRQRALLESHMSYIAAGSNVITANAFRTNKRAITAAFSKEVASRALIDEHNQDGLWRVLESVASKWASISEPLTQLALLLAHIARQQTPRGAHVAIAGNITTVEDCYEPRMVPSSDQDIRMEHEEKVRHLSFFPELIDVFLIETINTSREAAIAVDAALNAPIERPVWVSFVLDRDDGMSSRIPSRLYRSDKDDPQSGELLSEAINAVINVSNRYGRRIGAILFNCTTPQAISKAFSQLKNTGQISQISRSDVRLGGYANAEMYDPTSHKWLRPSTLTAEAYGQYALDWVEMGARIIGGCCGTNPNDIRHISNRLQDQALGG